MADCVQVAGLAILARNGLSFSRADTHSICYILTSRKQSLPCLGWRGSCLAKTEISNSPYNNLFNEKQIATNYKIINFILLVPDCQQNSLSHEILYTHPSWYLYSS